MAKNASTIALEADPNDAEDFDVSEAGVEEALATRRARGRPKGSTTSDREAVSLRLPRTVIEHFKKDGPGWQTRVVAVLSREAGQGSFRSSESGRFVSGASKAREGKERA